MTNSQRDPMAGVGVVGRYVARSWSSGSGPPRGGGGDRHYPHHPHHRGSWRLPAFFRRKFDIQRSGGRVGSSAPGGSDRGVSVTEDAFKDSAFRDPLKDPLRGPSCSDHYGGSSPYSEPDLHEAYREPRYLDLFDPGVSVVRDPKLDQPRAKNKGRAHSLVARTLGSLASTKCVVGCTVVLVVLVVAIVAVASTSRGALFGPDPRVHHPHVTTVTACGPAQGVIEKEAYVFRGLPYAVPPLGRYRFRPSQLQTSLEDCWSGTYQANITRPCWGYDSQGAVVAGSEDCLLVDIFTPQLGYDSPLPVVVYIGGASLGEDTRRPWLLSSAAVVARERQVVLVAPQVRRGMLGFLPHPRLAAATYPHTSGNQGVSDLLTALKWVHRNIEHFGGDPGRITLLGHEAGAAMAWPLLTSAQGHRLIHSAWLSGAPPLHPQWSWRDADPDLVDAVDCSTILCLENKPARAVMEAPSLEYRRPYGRPWLLADGVIVPFVPAKPQVPLMIGAAEQGSADMLVTWRERLGTSRQQLVDAVVDGLRLYDLRYGRDSMSPMGQGGRDMMWPRPPPGRGLDRRPGMTPDMYPRRPPMYPEIDMPRDTMERMPIGGGRRRMDARPIIEQPYEGRGIEPRPMDPRPMDPRPMDRRPVLGAPVDGRDRDGPRGPARDGLGLGRRPVDTGFMRGSREAETALSWYSELAEFPWLQLTTLVSDAVATCPALARAEDMARTESYRSPTGEEDVPIYSYVSRHARVSRVGAVADGYSDIEAILGVFRPQTRGDARYARTMQDMFFLFVTNSAPEWHTPTPAHLGVYVVEEDYKLERGRPQCQNWSNYTYFARRYK